MTKLKLFSIAALALVMGACSEQDNVLTEQPTEVPGVIYFSGTVSTNDGSTTRTTFTEGTNAAGKTIMNVAWKGDETIYLYQDGTEYGSASITMINEDGSAVISGLLSTEGYNIDENFDLKLFGTWTEKTYLDGSLEQDQYGTLADLGSFDYRVGSAKLVKGPGWSETNKEYVINGKVKLTSQMALWKLTLKDPSSNALNVTTSKRMQILSDGVVIAATGANFQGGTTNVVYLAMYPVEDKTITILYNDGTNNYMFSKTGVTLKANTYYQSEVTLTEYDGTKGTIQYLTSASESIELEDGDILTGKGGEDTKVIIADGASVTLHGVDITSINGKGWAGITCEGDATITLKGTNKVKGGDNEHPGILIPQGDAENPKTLTIEGDGKLEASGGEMAAGIGGKFRNACGNIVIKGGDITAESCGTGAGIGGSLEGNSGTINISGGKVTATSGGVCAGIGSGSGASCKGITITGGTVIATGGGHAAGIGGGEGSFDQLDSSGFGCGYIRISGGTVIATGGENAPGIGAGAANGWIYSTCGSITLSGGTITAIAGSNAPSAIGIGTNHSESGHTSTCKSIKITNDDDDISVAMTNAAAGESPNVGMFLNASSLTLLGDAITVDSNTSSVTGFTTNTYNSTTWTLVK